MPATFQPGEMVEGFVGIDGGSTSTKAVLISKDHKRRILAKTYQLSKGNPIEDTIEVLEKLNRQILDQGADLKILGVGTTGYAKDILKDVVGADAALVETVAHTEAGLHFYDDVDVICDVGGQDIKIIILKHGRVKDFKLNTQCSAGNGYFLQSTAQGFNVPVEEYADTAFGAKGFPSFGYGCAVFMQSDIVDFQRQGWKPEEIMAGLCNVLPKNIWLYVSQIPNLSAIGRRFLLQGGTQYNLAAVKAQVDFIESRFKGKDVQADVIVHEHCGEAGAIGAALEAGRLFDNGRKTTFIGLEAARGIQYKTTRNESTRCYFCKNKCLRTFIDVKTSLVNLEFKPPVKTKVPLEAGAQRLIIATCEKGTVENIEEMRQIKGDLDKVKKANPNFVEIAAKAVFRVQDAPLVADAPPKLQITPAQKKRAALIKKRADLRIGMPRVLNMYSQTPVFTGYFASLGIRAENIVYSDFTSEELYKEGAKRGAIDPCFPSKLGIPHVHNLLYRVHAKKPLDIIFFPMIDCLTSDLHSVQASRSCPTVAATPEAVKAAFTKEGDLFAEKGVTYLDTFVNLSKPDIFERQMYEQFRDILGLSPEENHRAIEEGYRALDVFNNVTMRGAAREALEELEREDKLGVVLLGRPYHNDPGINHEILEEFQKLGYPVFTEDCLPIDDDIVWRLFGDDVLAGEIRAPDGHHRRVEEFLQREHQPQSVGGQIRGAPSQPGRAGAIELQVRPRCAYLLRGRRDRRAFRHSVFLLQGHRREQAHRLDQDPRGNHRLLPEALPRGHDPQQEQSRPDRRAASRVRSQAAAADVAREAGRHGGRFRNRRHAADPRERRRAGCVEPARARVRAGVRRLSAWRWLSSLLSRQSWRLFLTAAGHHAPANVEMTLDTAGPTARATALFPDSVAHGEPILAALAGLAEAALLSLGFGNHRWHHGWHTIFVHGDECQIGGAGMALGAGEQVFGDHAYAHFERGVEDAIHGRAQHNELPDVHRMQEVEAVHRRGDHAAARVPHRRHGAGEVHQMHHLAAKHVPPAVGVDGQRQFGIFGSGFAYGFTLHGTP